MNGPKVFALWHTQGVSSEPLRNWIQNNVVPLILLSISVILLWISGRGGNNPKIGNRRVRAPPCSGMGEGNVRRSTYHAAGGRKLFVSLQERLGAQAPLVSSA